MSGGQTPAPGLGRAAVSGPETAPPGAGADTSASAPARDRAAGRGTRAVTIRRVLSQVVLICGFVAAGVIVTWPTARNLGNGQLIKVPDISSYVWALWWMAHQVAHLGDPWFTTYMAAPVGVRLGFDTLMPLPGLIMTPVTLLFGPSASFAVLTIAMPGLLCYVTYRAAR